MASVAQQSPSRSPPPPPTKPKPVAATGVEGAAAGTSSSVSVSKKAASKVRTTSSGSLNFRSTRDSDITNLVPSASECSYAACFCEENVWKLADHVQRNSPAELSKTFVVFVSNEGQVVPLWRQKAGRDEEKLVIWDYHVIFVYKSDERRCIVFDLDSDLPFPTFFQKYVTETFRTDAIMSPEYHRFFRVIPSALFLARFASDRRHMRKPDGSGWMKPPPPYECISTPTAKHTLDEFIAMDKNSDLGQLLNLTEFVRMFFRQ